jgi:hypothetical protein
MAAWDAPRLDADHGCHHAQLTWIKASHRRTCKMAVSQNPYRGAEPGR